MCRDSLVAPVSDKQFSCVLEISSAFWSEANSITRNRRLTALLVPGLGSERIFYLSMQEDRQPNEIRAQRKGDHRIPKVRSSTSLGRYRQSRISDTTRFKPKKSWRHNRTPRNHDEAVVTTTDVLSSARGSNRRPNLPPPPQQGSTSAQDRSATDRQPIASSVSTADIYEENL